MDAINRRCGLAERCEKCEECLPSDNYYNIWNPRFVKCAMNGISDDYSHSGYGDFVYFISDGSAVKIGYATNVSIRLAQLQTGNPNKLKVIAQIPFCSSGYARSAEKKFHNIYSDFAATGEWFKILGLIDVEAFKKEYPPITEGENE